MGRPLSFLPRGPPPFPPTWSAFPLAPAQFAPRLRCSRVRLLPRACVHRAKRHRRSPPSSPMPAPTRARTTWPTSASTHPCPAPLPHSAPTEPAKRSPLPPRARPAPTGRH